MPLSAFFTGHFRKLIRRECSRQLSILLISSVIGKVQYFWEKKASDSTELWNLNKRIKEILTHGHQQTVQCKKCISHPNLMIKNAFSENKTCYTCIFPEFQLQMYARAYVYIWELRPCIWVVHRLGVSVLSTTFLILAIISGMTHL